MGAEPARAAGVAVRTDESRRSERPLISVVSPVYRSADSVSELVRRIKEAVETFTENFEIVLVEDGSPDDSWDRICFECALDSRVRGLSLSRNFGQHFAITAGLSHATGDSVVLMDCDLQDDPVYIPGLYRTLQEGYSIVYTRRRQRHYGAVKNLFSKVFYGFLSWVSEFDLDPNVGNYTILSRQAVDSFLKFNDYRRGYLFVLRWLGFRTTSIEVEHKSRPYGESSYSFGRLIRLATDLALSYSDKPLRLAIYTGLFFALLSVFGTGFLVWRYFSGSTLPGWTSTLVALALIGGIVMLFLGIIGLYISKIFEQTKNRPLYLIQETRNFQP